MVDVEEVYRIIGEEGFERLVAAFYRQIPGDDILGPMYRAAEPGSVGTEEERMAAAEARLRDFLIFRFGGPQRYIERRGHPALRARHIPFQVDKAARDRWVLLMNNAIDEAQLPAEVADVIREFLGNVATFLINKSHTQA